MEKSIEYCILQGKNFKLNFQTKMTPEFLTQSSYTNKKKNEEVEKITIQTSEMLTISLFGEKNSFKSTWFLKPEAENFKINMQVLRNALSNDFLSFFAIANNKTDTFKLTETGLQTKIPVQTSSDKTLLIYLSLNEEEHPCVTLELDGLEVRFSWTFIYSLTDTLEKLDWKMYALNMINTYSQQMCK